MARRRFHKRIYETNVDLTPMLDIVFIMLIFFVATATFLNEHGLDLTQPSSDDSVAICDCGPTINVYLFEDGSASVNGIKTNIRNILSRIHAINADQPGSSVILGADKAAKHGNVVFVKVQLDAALINVTLKIRTQ